MECYALGEKKAEKSVQAEFAVHHHDSSRKVGGGKFHVSSSHSAP